MQLNQTCYVVSPKQMLDPFNTSSPKGHRLIVRAWHNSGRWTPTVECIKTPNAVARLSENRALLQPIKLQHDLPHHNNGMTILKCSPFVQFFNWDGRCPNRTMLIHQSHNFWAFKRFKMSSLKFEHEQSKSSNQTRHFNSVWTRENYDLHYY